MDDDRQGPSNEPDHEAGNQRNARGQPGPRPPAVAEPAPRGTERRPLLVLLLDGVSYERIAQLWDAGHFRMFQRPARVISVFPTLTDPAYDAFFRCGPTPGYEAGYFDRAANRLSRAFRLYLSGANERWVRYADYRLGFFEDAVMYLFPRRTFRRELRRTRAVVHERLAGGGGDVVVYILSTDGLGHMLAQAGLDEELRELDRWLARLSADYHGALEVVVLCDHGMSATPTRRFRLRRRLRKGGLRVARRLKRTGDVAVPVFGLLDVARLHVHDETTRERTIAALAGCPQVELLAWRDRDGVGLRTPLGRARVVATRLSDRLAYRYEPLCGDPLGLRDACAAMRAAGSMNHAGFATGPAWLARTADHDFPAAVPRLWDGLFRLSDERPDVVLSLAEGWFVGSGLLARCVRMQGTHGGLHRRVSETFAMSTRCELPSPIGLEELYGVLRQRHGWEPTARGWGAGPRSEKNEQGLGKDSWAR